MRRASRVAILIAAAGLFCLLGLAGLVLLLAPQSPAPFGLWQRLSQIVGAPQDFGPTDFATLTRRPGDALLCPPDLCLATQADAVPPVFTISAPQLAARLRAYASAEIGVEDLPAAGPEHLRFVRRSLILRLPDVIDARILPRSSGAATLALYARPVLSVFDFGASRVRMERWMDGLAQ